MRVQKWWDNWKIYFQFGSLFTSCRYLLGKRADHFCWMVLIRSSCSYRSPFAWEEVKDIWNLLILVLHINTLQYIAVQYWNLVDSGSQSATIAIQNFFCKSIKSFVKADKTLRCYISLQGSNFAIVQAQFGPHLVPIESKRPQNHQL